MAASTGLLRPNEPDGTETLRIQALDRRWKRQQGELFPETSETFQETVEEAAEPCPNCGEVGYQPVFALSDDSSVGYHSEEQCCTACMADAVEPWTRQDWEDYYGDAAGELERD
jgi:hypothetical protein